VFLLQDAQGFFTKVSKYLSGSKHTVEDMEVEDIDEPEVSSS